MSGIVCISTFINAPLPFRKFHFIFFKKRSESFKTYGTCIYGKFVPFYRLEKMSSPAPSMLKVDSPRVNGCNTHLSMELVARLYFKGLRFEDIDLAATYGPGLLEQKKTTA